MFVVASIGILLMLIYSLGFYEQNTSATKISTINPGEWISRTQSQERIYVWFYFTFISNMFAVVLGATSLFKNHSFDSKHWQRAKVMMVVNLVITFLVYWIMLAKGANWHNGLAVVQNMFVHLLTPILAVVAFLWETEKTDRSKRNISALETVAWNFIFPVVWLIVVLIVYYATGAKESSAIYATITDFKNHPKVTVMTIIGVAIAYPLLTMGAAYTFSRKFKWNIKLSFKRR